MKRRMSRVACESAYLGVTRFFNGATNFLRALFASRVFGSSVSV
jgi:hypothetical protein